MEGIECNFCKKTFKNSSVLKNHKQTAKYCLKIQKENNITDIKENLKICEYCEKTFASSTLKRHQSTCKIKNSEINIEKEKIKELENDNIQLQKEVSMLKKHIIELNSQILEYKDDIIKYKDEIKDYEMKLTELKGELTVYKKDHECLLDIAKQPKSHNYTTNNNKILNISSSIDFTDINKIRDIIENNYTMEYFLDGQKGFAKFALENLLIDDEGNLKYICTDPSRQIFKYKDSLGDIQKDVEARKLTNYLVDGGLRKKALDLTNNLYMENDNINIDKMTIALQRQESLMKLKDDNNVFKKELVAMTTV